MLVIDERQQKTNLVSFNNFNYDALLIGSSRTANINSSSLLPVKTFNYACKSMVYNEYYDYIEFAKKKNGKDFKYIFIGLDFFSTNKSIKDEKFQKMENIKASSEYFKNTADNLYKIKTLLNFDNFKWSMKTLLFNLVNIKPPDVYNNRASNDKFVNNWSLIKTKNELKEQLNIYSNVAYYNYVYDDSFKQHLSAVIKANPDSKIVVYTTPVSEPLFKLLVEKNLIEQYYRWLSDIVDTFGSFYHFMDINSITTNHYDYFIDAHHMYPQKSSLITDKLLKKEKSDFGILINSENLNSYIESLRTASE